MCMVNNRKSTVPFYITDVPLDEVEKIETPMEFVDEVRWVPPAVEEAIQKVKSQQQSQPQCSGPDDMFRSRTESLPGDED